MKTPEPQFISSYDPGRHNEDIDKTITRLDHVAAYKDLSTIIVVPALGSVPTRAVASWLSLISPPNHKLVRIFAVGMEVGDAYSKAIDSILKNTELSTFKYLLTLEVDNVPPPDGLINLLARAEENPDYAAIGGLYWTKGHGGQAQIWGNPKEHPINFKPCKPDRDGGLVECNGTGMGFTLFRIELFKDERLRKPWFVTKASTKDGVATQDLWFWQDARKYGHRCAVDCSVRVGHYDINEDITW